MSLCLATTALALGLAAEHFTLEWTHSVERTRWREHWAVQAGQLVLEQAAVQGSGAGMEPPADAVWRDGWWVYPGQLPPQAVLRLAVSGATVSSWRLCTDAGCLDVDEAMRLAGRRPSVVELHARPGCRPLDR